MNPSAILHVTSPFGGGVDRHLRDVLRTVDRAHLVWHAGDGVDVIEDAASGRFYPLAADAAEAPGAALARWLRARRVGLVHLHQLTLAPRRRAQWVCETLGVPHVVTLHDILFLSADAFSRDDPLQADAAWLGETSRTLRAARAVLAPTRWLADLAAARVPGLAVEVLPNGSRDETATAMAPREAFTAQRPARVVALLGALGPHKGSAFADAIAGCLEGTDIGLVVIGYLDRQLHPGWRIPGRLFVHGAFAEGDAPGLLRGYGASLVVLPGTVPESFSYALSDAWAAGVPVLAAPQGALAERIAAHGGGWLLPPESGPEAIAAEIRALAGGAREGERARVQSSLAQPDATRIPPLDAMSRSLDAFYTRFGIDPAAPEAADEAAIASVLATNLDARLFRQELVRLCDEFEDATRRAGAFESEARDWIAKLEADVRTVQAALAACDEARQQLAVQAGVLEAEVARLAPHKEAFDLLPAIVRRLLLKLAVHARR